MNPPKVEANCGRNSERASELHPASLRKTAINDAIRIGTTVHEVREFAGHADIRTTEVSFVRQEEDAEVAARRIPHPRHGTQGPVSPGHSVRRTG